MVVCCCASPRNFQRMPRLLQMVRRCRTMMFLPSSVAWSFIGLIWKDWSFFWGGYANKKPKGMTTIHWPHIMSQDVYPQAVYLIEMHWKALKFIMFSTYTQRYTNIHMYAHIHLYVSWPVTIFPIIFSGDSQFGGAGVALKGCRFLLPVLQNAAGQWWCAFAWRVGVTWNGMRWM